MLLQGPLVLALLPAIIARIRGQISGVLLLNMLLDNTLITEMFAAQQTHMSLAVDTTFQMN